jgi:hypothetical protein
MPFVHMIRLLDANGEPVLEVMAAGEGGPGEETLDALRDTIERFGLDVVGSEADSFMVCRGCGCSDDAACPGGCSWVEEDLCSRCELAESVKPPALVMP